MATGLRGKRDVPPISPGESAVGRSHEGWRWIKPPCFESLSHPAAPLHELSQTGPPEWSALARHQTETGRETGRETGGGRGKENERE